LIASRIIMALTLMMTPKNAISIKRTLPPVSGLDERNVGMKTSG
jgi:hypothetical protein